MKYSLKYRILKIFERIGILKSISFTLKNNNHKYSKVPIIRGMGLGNIIDFEPWMDSTFERIKSHIQNKVFLDIGVNLGQTLIKLKDLDAEIDYMGIEPNPYCIFYVQELIHLNNIKNARLIPIGLSNETSIKELYLKNGSNVDGGATIISGFREGEFRKIDIFVSNLDSLEIVKAADIGCIKIDVEGAENDVIRGAYNTISQKRPLILCEILPVYSDQNKKRLERQIHIEQLIKELNYLIYRLDNASGALLKIDKIGIHSNLSMCEYVFCPKELNIEELNAAM